MPYLPEKYRLLPLLQSVWYIGAGLDIWNQLLAKYPGRYATMKGIHVPPPDYGPVVWLEDAEPIREEGTLDERLHAYMIATMTGNSRRAHGLFLGLAEDEATRPALRETIEFLGLIDLQDTVIGRKARNTGHKAIRARAVTDLANYIGWEKSHGVFYMGVPDMAVGPLYYSLYDHACVRINAEFPEDAGKNLKKTNQTPLSPREVEEMLDVLMTADQDTVFDLITAHLKSGQIDQEPRRRDPDRRCRADPAQHGAAAVHQRAAPVRLLQRREQLAAHHRQSVPGARAVPDGQLHQRRRAREQVAYADHRRGDRGVRFLRASRRRRCSANSTRRSWRSTAPRATAVADAYLRIRGGPPALHGDRRARRLPLPGRPAQPEDHDLDVRGVRAQLDASARPTAARDGARCWPAGSRCRASATALPVSRRSGSTTDPFRALLVPPMSIISRRQTECRPLICPGGQFRLARSEASERSRHASAATHALQRWRKLQLILRDR